MRAFSPLSLSDCFTVYTMQILPCLHGNQRNGKYFGLLNTAVVDLSERQRLFYRVSIKTSSPWTVMLSWLQHAYSRLHFFRTVIYTCKVGHINLVLVCDQGSLIGLCTQDYKSVCSGYDLCHPAVVNTQTQIHTHVHTNTDNIGPYQLI